MLKAVTAGQAIGRVGSTGTATDLIYTLKLESMVLRKPIKLYLLL